GAPALGLVTVAFWLAVRRPLGISGIWGRFLRFREERRIEEVEARLASQTDAVRNALDEATRQAMAEARAAGMEIEGGPAGEPPRPRRALGPRPTLAAHATFLVALALGGLLSRLVRGAPAGPGLGAAFEAFAGTGARAVGILVAGGVLVGLGTTLAAGCPSGHGLSGCSRLEPGSLVAAASFLAAAVGTTFLLAGGAG
ncbi:MAG TPA: hypothetical protein VLS93_07885, partial [Anaeromyxobacteraceae bacterium]|nr:hypothetical protein [Anaeromyxobacteraceae bacterium]